MGLILMLLAATSVALASASDPCASLKCGDQCKNPIQGSIGLTVMEYCQAPDAAGAMKCTTTSNPTCKTIRPQLNGACTSDGEKYNEYAVQCGNMATIYGCTCQNRIWQCFTQRRARRPAVCAHDCQTRDVSANWTPDKKKHCCQTHGKECGTTMPSSDEKALRCSNQAVDVKKVTQVCGKEFVSSQCSCAKGSPSTPSTNKWMCTASQPAQGCDKDYCLKNPKDAGCQNEPVVCCKALTASCMSCAEGVTPAEYCAKNPKTDGCTPASTTCDGKTTCCPATHTCITPRGGTEKMCVGKDDKIAASVTCPKPSLKDGCCVFFDGCNTHTRESATDKEWRVTKLACLLKGEEKCSKQCSAPVACCEALTASCMSCAAGVTQAEYCAKNPKTYGCKTDTCTCGTKCTAKCPAGKVCAAIALNAYCRADGTCTGTQVPICPKKPSARLQAFMAKTAAAKSAKELATNTRDVKTAAAKAAKSKASKAQSAFETACKANDKAQGCDTLKADVEVAITAKVAAETEEKNAVAAAEAATAEFVKAEAAQSTAEAAESEVTTTVPGTTKSSAATAAASLTAVLSAVVLSAMGMW